MYVFASKTSGGLGWTSQQNWCQRSLQSVKDSWRRTNKLCALRRLQNNEVNPGAVSCFCLAGSDRNPTGIIATRNAADSQRVTRSVDFIAYKSEKFEMLKKGKKKSHTKTCHAGGWRSRWPRLRQSFRQRESRWPGQRRLDYRLYVARHSLKAVYIHFKTRVSTWDRQQAGKT